MGTQLTKMGNLNSQKRVKDMFLIARAAHEAVRSYSVHYSMPVPPMWSELSQEAQAALLNSCVNSLAGMSKEEFHNSWVRMKSQQGWVWGEVLSIENKQHPAMKEYRELQEVYRAKNDMFWEVSRSVAKSIGVPVADPIQEG